MSLIWLDENVFQFLWHNPDQQGQEIDQLNEADDTCPKEEAEPASNFSWNLSLKSSPVLHLIFVTET